jgi:hypothetical protein
VRERLARALDPAFRDGWLLGDEGRDLAHGDRPRTPAGVLIALVPRPPAPPSSSPSAPRTCATTPARSACPAAA